MSIEQKFILDKLKELKPKYEKEGFFIIGIFGSYARDEFNKDSDVDILYNINQKFVKKYGGWGAILKLEELKSELQNELRISKIDLATLDSNNHTLQTTIQKELIYV